MRLFDFHFVAGWARPR